MYLLDRMEYIGHTANFKTYKKSYKDRNRKAAPKDDRVIAALGRYIEQQAKPTVSHLNDHIITLHARINILER